MEKNWDRNTKEFDLIQFFHFFRFLICHQQIESRIRDRRGNGIFA